MPSMLFTLTGRDELSDVFDDIGDAARRMGRRITVASIEADREMRRLGRTTELVIYPGEGHGISRPSFQKDRYQRYLGWYDKFVKGS